MCMCGKISGRENTITSISFQWITSTSDCLLLSRPLYSVSVVESALGDFFPFFLTNFLKTFITFLTPLFLLLLSALLSFTLPFIFLAAFFESSSLELVFTVVEPPGAIDGLCASVFLPALKFGKFSSCLFWRWFAGKALPDFCFSVSPTFPGSTSTFFSPLFSFWNL